MSAAIANAKSPPSTTAMAASKPIEILTSPSSQVYANLHPILLLSLLYLSFPNLVRDPVNTLISLLPTVTLLQATYCVLCVPVNGQSQTQSTPKPGSKKRGVRTEQTLWNRIVPALLSLLLTLALATPITHITVILFGAPLTTHLAHTLLLALHLALLTAPHLFYAHGIDKDRWFKILSLQVAVDEVLGTTLGACVGAWLGAIPIPLDWDREWQKWPVTIVVGMYIGVVVGKVLGGWVFRGRRIVIS